MNECITLCNFFTGYIAAQLVLLLRGRLVCEDCAYSNRVVSDIICVFIFRILKMLFALLQISYNGKKLPFKLETDELYY